MKTLEELKAENAAAEAKTTEPPQAEVEEAEIVVDETETDETGEDADLGESESEEVESESWMQSDEQTLQEDAERTFTGSDIAAAKRKLRAKLEKGHNSEIEELRAEIERIKNQTTAQQGASQAEQSIPRPKLEDFDHDEDAHAEALDKWDDARLEAKVRQATTGQQQNTQRQQEVEAFTKTVDQHYERAAKLAKEHGITAEVYQQSDLAVRTAIEQVMPNQGDLVTDQLINALGEGSEKVMFYIGRNKGKTAELQSAILSDPSGMKAMAFLGKMSSEANGPQKRTSRAPKPATQIKGDESAKVSAEAKALKAAYEKADKSGDTQARFDARRKAKQAGVDVSSW